MSDPPVRRDDTPPDPIEMLLRSAGAGIEPDASRMERAMLNVHREWHETLASRRTARRQTRLAACAAVILIATLVVTLWPAAASPVATAVRLTGGALVRHARSTAVSTELLSAGRVVMAGDEIDTGAAGRVLLDLTSGAQLRIDTHSVAQWKSPTELQLLSGTVYVETRVHPASQASSVSHIRQLTVSTPWGDVRHVGTRFEVQVAEGSTLVRVRDGLVSFSAKSAAPVMVRAGQQLSISNSVITLQPGPGSAAPEWDWLRAIGPSFAIEGRTLSDTLDWLSGETGLQVIYLSDGARSQAHALILRGTIDGLDTRQALLAVLAGSGLAFELRADRVEIRAE